MSRGKIIKGIGGFYYVVSEGKVYTCRAKGIFRKDNVKPMVGDDVEISVIAGDEGSIEDILPRRKSLIRPAVANIDEIIVVQSVAKPSPQFYLLDRYLLSTDLQGVPAVIVFNKSDLVKEFDDIYKKAGYKTFLTSAHTGEGMDELRDYIKGKSVAFAGPSGVGKSSITNMLFPEAQMITGGISRKIERGKHTTRHSEIFAIGDDTYICDTPGFTSVMFEDLEPENLKTYFAEFNKYEGHCRFNGCVHLKEPECAVKTALTDGMISQSRYDSYCKIYEELNDLKVKRY